LRERGAVDRALADAVENLVTLVENLARTKFEALVPGAAEVLRDQVVFDRLVTRVSV